MADLYAELIPLTSSLGEIDREIELVTAPLRAKRAEIQAKIDEVAARILGSKTAVSAAETVNPVTKIVLHEPTLGPLPHVPPRRLKLLQTLANQPDADFGALSVAMYGGDDRSKRSALSAEFSGLNKEGLVEAQGAGRFKLTPLAQRVLIRQENGARAQP